MNTAKASEMEQYDALENIAGISNLDYEISYQAAGEGELVVSDGMFQLDIRHTADEMICKTDKGEETLALGDGEYRLSVRSGVLEVTRNGHFEASYLLPLSEEAPCVRTKGLVDAKVSIPENREVYCAGKGKTEFTAQNVSQNWSLEFEKEGTEDEFIEVSDGSYHLKLYIHDYIVGFCAPLGGTGGQSEQLCKVPEGRHLYRVTSIRGIAMLYIDNVWAGSMRLPSSEVSPRLMRSFAPGDAMTIWRKEADEWTFNEDFEDTKSLQPAEFWLGDADMSFATDEEGSRMIVKGGNALLNGFLKDVEISAKLKVTVGSGKVGLISQYCEDIKDTKDLIKIFAGFDGESHKWVIQKIHGNEVYPYAEAEGNISEGEWLDVTLKMSGKTASLLVNGEEVVLTNNVDYAVHGRVGICAEGDGAVEVDNVCVTGDGRITGGILELQFDGLPIITFLEMNDGSLLQMSGDGGNDFIRRSKDQGRTFKLDAAKHGLTDNTIRLQNGEILTIRRNKGAKPETYWYDAYISNDEGKTYDGPYRMNTVERNRITMQDKLMQARSGRILYVGGEIGHAQETYGRLVVYYSDDNGRTWGECKEEISIFNTGVNVQEGVVTDLPDGTVRLYMRTDRGFIYYTDSKDGGETWDMNLKPTALPASMCALNIVRDPWEEETYYMVWEYDNKNVDRTAQHPRNRVAMAVSYDGCENWEYVADLSARDLYLDGKYTMFGHMNEGVRVFEDYIMADVCVVNQGGDNEKGRSMYVWRIDKDKIRTQKRFPIPYLVK